MKTEISVDRLKKELSVREYEVAQRWGFGGNFTWKDQFDVFRKVCDMPTRHLFFTVRLVWNHRMPEAAKLKPYKRYALSPFYTDYYLSCAVRFMLCELYCRDDIKPEWWADLEYMARYVLKGSRPVTIQRTRLAPAPKKLQEVNHDD